MPGELVRLQQPAVVGFNYDALSNDDAHMARQAAERIKGRMKASMKEIIEAGSDLIAVKAQLGRGAFGAWIVAEFGMTDKTAQNYMRAATVFGDFAETVSVLPQGLVYKLAAKSTPEAIREDVILRIEEGQQVEPDEIQTAIDNAKQQERQRQEAERQHQEAEREEARLAKLTPEQRADEDRKAKRRHQTRAQREAKEAREREEWKAEQERAERAAQEAVELVAERLGSEFGRFKSLVKQAGYRFRDAVEAAKAHAPVEADAQRGRAA